jgi:hypothetical protein
MCVWCAWCHLHLNLVFTNAVCAMCACECTHCGAGTPLHVAAGSAFCPLAVLDLLLDTFPQALLLRDEVQLIPLRALHPLLWRPLPLHSYLHAVVLAPPPPVKPLLATPA